MPLPDPLHPAVVHFPIVLLLFGAPLALLAVFVPRLAVLAAVVLSLGAAGSVAAVATGLHEKRNEIATPEGEGRELLRRHEQSGETARNAALTAAFFSVGAAVWRRTSWHRVAMFFACASMAASLVAAWSVAVSGHTGGELVYRHGVGLRF